MPEIDAVWREQRPYLLSVAFRMLGNIGDAEDAVQEAFTRLLRADVDEINDMRGWLVVVLSRICLDQLGSAHTRREAAHDPDGGPFAHSEGAPDPAERVTLDDNVRLALLVVLEQLTPAERTVFVLREVFQYPFESVAEIVGRTPAACRQLASRAKRRIEAAAPGPSRFVVEPADDRRVVEQFVAACAGGEVEPLMHLLDEDVVGDADLGGAGPHRPVHGRDQVATNIMRFFNGNHGVTLVTQPVGDRPGVLAFIDRRLVASVSFQIRDGRIFDIHSYVEPDGIPTMLAHLTRGV
jgi:RNA polymerase sigma-70 factor (ECF subfamily)